MREAPRHLVARGFAKALHAATNIMADALESVTPEKAEDTGGLLDKGELRESLTIKIELDADYRGGSGQISFGKNQMVADWVEWGHRGRVASIVTPSGAIITRGKTSTVDVPPHPFMRPTTDIYGDAAIDAFAESMRGTVQDEFEQGLR